MKRFDDAIEHLKSAYQRIEITDVDYGAEVFTRMPMYLQKAGRDSEGWQELLNLQANGYPNQCTDFEILPMTTSSILDKMRLFLQRTNNYDEAVKYGILSYISWAIGLFRQHRIDELRIMAQKGEIEELLSTLLKKTKLVARKKELVYMISSNLVNVSQVELKKVELELTIFIEQTK